MTTKRHKIGRRQPRPRTTKAVPATGLGRMLLRSKLATLSRANLELHRAGVAGTSALRKRIVSEILRTENRLHGVSDRDYPPGWEDDE